MDALDITVYDKNVRYLLNDGNQSNSHRTPDGGLNAMFPTNVKYIFEDDADAVGEAIADETIENVIIVHIQESGALDDVELISDQYELLNFRKGNVGTSTSEESLDIELDVLSQFCDLSTMVSDLPLGDLIRLYTIQNEQLQTISNSI